MARAAGGDPALVQVCRHCKKPARRVGGQGLPESMRKAVHAATGLESCDPGGERAAAPIDPDMARAS